MFGYGKYRRGFRSGGINGRPVELSQVQDYDPEYLDSFELGLKTLLADRRVRLNAAVFYNKYKDIQVLLTRGARSRSTTRPKPRSMASRSTSRRSPPTSCSCAGRSD